VNKRPLITIATATPNLFDLLTAAGDFMLFDTTIVGVRISQLTLTLTGGASTQLKTFGASLLVGPTELDQQDVTSPIIDSIGPSWLWHGFASVRVPAAAEATLNIVTSAQGQGGLLVKAQRRFRENNATLFLLVVYTDGGAVDTNIQVDGFIRTLIRIP